MKNHTNVKSSIPHYHSTQTVGMQGVATGGSSGNLPQTSQDHRRNHTNHKCQFNNRPHHSSQTVGLRASLGPLSPGSPPSTRVVLAQPNCTMKVAVF